MDTMTASSPVTLKPYSVKRFSLPPSSITLIYRLKMHFLMFVNFCSILESLFLCWIYFCSFMIVPPVFLTGIMVDVVNKTRCIFTLAYKHKL